MILEWFSRFLPTASELKKEVTLPDTGSEPTSTNAANGFFHQATNFTIHGAHMYDHPQNFQIIHNTIFTGTAALDRLLPYTCPDAAVDSSARDPPPRCHPGTRQRILDALNAWLISHLWKIFWLSGPAGTGKSAVAQTFAEMCLEQGRLGAAYFFFRSSGRNDPRTVIPSLAYQLAVNAPDYDNLLGHAIALDPSIFQKTPRVQLRKLIVEPFTRLQAQGHKSTRIQRLIVLDGLDECQGIQAQCDIVEMIGEVVRLKKDFPILWLVTSRPEPHLQYIFSRADFSIECKKELLLINADTKDDVDHYLRDSFIDIRTRFSLVTDATWPSKAQSQRVGDITSGLFALAATIISYISDITYGDPVGRLTDFLAFVTNANHVTTTNPLQTLDLLYSQILSEIPANIYPTTRRILSFHQLLPFPIQLSCNFLSMDKYEFYNALSKLHSLFDVASPDEARGAGLKMHHASFHEYLRSPFRSGRFHISREDSVVDFFKALLFWYKIILQDPRFVSDGPFKMIENIVILPGLKWISNDNGNNQVTSKCITKLAYRFFLSNFRPLPAIDVEETLNQLEDFDFRYMLVNQSDVAEFARFAEWLFTLGPRNTLLHVESQDELEETLLNKVIHEAGQCMEPAAFPMAKTTDSESPYRYIFIGHGTRSCLFWFNKEWCLMGRCRLSCKALTGEKYTISDCVIHLSEEL